MGRPKGSGKKKIEELVQSESQIFPVENDVTTNAQVDVKIDVLRSPRASWRGEFERNKEHSGPIQSAVFECAERHTTIGASNYEAVPCRICSMESTLKEIRKGVLQ